MRSRRPANRGIAGMKVEIRGPRMLLQARIGGRIRRDEVDITKPHDGDRLLFDD